MKVNLYGIPNCDQVKKARSWLSEHDVDVQFHDFKKSGVTPELIQQWLTQLTTEVLINRKGTTWRKLSEQEQVLTADEQGAIACMIAHPSVIKRPILVLQTKERTDIVAGFSEENYQRLFSLRV